MKSSFNPVIDKFDYEIDCLSKRHDIPKRIIATIALNESECNPFVKPYVEKTWRYFTDKDGKPLNIVRGTTKEIQDTALGILGEEEFNFQIRAHGAFQTVGSVLRELGYKPTVATTDFLTQGNFAMLHLSKMHDRFVKKFRKEPSYEQMYAMYNGGFGAVNEDGIEDYVAGYVKKSLVNELRSYRSV